MRKLFLTLAFLIAFTGSALSTDINLGASSITGFNTANAGVDTSLSGVTVTLGSPSVTCSSCLPAGAVGLSGMKVSLGTPTVTYDIASVTSRSAFTLTSNYLASSGTVTGTLHKFVHLRIYVLSPFIPSGSSTVVQSGAPGTTAWYRRYGVSIVNDGAQNVAFVPAIDNLPATTDSSVPTARYYAAFYTQGGGFMQSYPGCVDDFRLDHATTPTSWAQVCTFNSPAASPPPQPINFYTTSQIDARFPSCTVNQLIYYAATGNVQSCLSFAPGDFSISGGVLSSLNVTKQLQEEGADLPIRSKINFVGTAYTAADDAGNGRTNVTADADLNALASLTGTGFAQRTGVDTWALNANVVTGPASATDNAIARFDLTTGKIIQNSVVTVADTSGNFSVPNDWAVASVGGSSMTLGGDGGPVFAAPASATAFINGFTFNQGAQTQSSGVSRGLILQPTYNQTGTAGSSALSLFRTETALGSGTHNLIDGFGGAAGTTSRFRINNLGNYFFGASGGFIGDENGNEYLSFATLASAVNNVQINNAATTGAPVVAAVGDDTNINLLLVAKGTGRVVIKGYPFALDVDATPTGNVTTGLDSIYSFTIPAASLAGNLDFVEFKFGGNLANNDNDKRFQATIDGQVIFDTGLFDFDGAVNGQWSVTGQIVRVSATSVVVTTQLLLDQIAVVGAGTLVSSNGIYSSRNVTLTVSNLTSNAVVIQLNAEATATNDVVRNSAILTLTQR